MLTCDDEQIEEWSEKGLLFAVDAGSIVKYQPNKCNFTGGRCSTNCNLFINGKCAYRTSLHGELYRQVDNKFLFEGHQKSDKEVSTDEKDGGSLNLDSVDALHGESAELLIEASQNPIPPPLPDILKEENRKYEELKKFLEEWSKR